MPSISSWKIRAAAFLLALLPSAGFAQNELPNADFDTDLAGWDTTTGTDWSAIDSDGSTESGSVQISVTGFQSTAITVCVPVTGGQTYELGADVLIDAQGQATGKALVVARWEGDAQCTQELPDFPAFTSVTAADDWTNLTLVAPAPDDAVAALFELRLQKSGGSEGSTITANFDDALFQPALSPGCADPVSPFNKITAGDALFVLRASVGTADCDQCFCNVNGSGGTTASDALVTLKAAVSIAVALACPACG